jgi:hypothetical protein
MNTIFILTLSSRKAVACTLLVCLLFTSVNIFGQQSMKWSKSYGNSGYDKIHDIATDAAGNIYVTGRFENSFDFDPGPAAFILSANGLSDMFISKFDANGNFMWARGLGGPEWDMGNTLEVDAAGNIYVAGIFSDTANFYNGSPTMVNLISNGLEDISILKLNSNGVLVWAKSIGGTGQDYVADITVDLSGNIFFIGSYNFTVDFDPGPGVYGITSAGGWDAFTVELDNNGDFAWAAGMGSANFDTGWGITLDTKGNLYMTGSFVGSIDFNPGHGVNTITSSGSDDIFLVKLTPGKQLLWAKKQGGSGWECAGNIAVDTSGNIYNTGRFMGTADLDPGPGVYNVTAVGTEDFFVSQLDASGNFVWAGQIGSSGLDCGSVQLDPSGNIFLSGQFAGAADLDPGPGTYNVNSGSETGVFMTELSPSGNFICAGAIKGTGDVEGVMKLSGGDLIIGGGFENTADFNPGSGMDSLSSAGQLDIFLGKLSSCVSAGVSEPLTHNSASNMSVFPNPSNGKFRVKGNEEQQTEIRVYNMLGDEILYKVSKTSAEEIDMSNQPKGVYFVNIIAGKEKIIKRMIIQ